MMMKYLYVPAISKIREQLLVFMKRMGSWSGEEAIASCVCNLFTERCNLTHSN